MNIRKNESTQVKLAQHQIEAFYSDRLANDQVRHFLEIHEKCPMALVHVAVDVGGGCGHFARQLSEKTGFKTRVIDSDSQSIDACRREYGSHVDAEVGDALDPPIHGDENLVCFNLILHHLVAKNEKSTRELQKMAIANWANKAKFIFVNEYIYDSYLSGFSGRFIYEITKNPVLSTIGKLVSIVFPSLRANTFGVGVRFRSHDEWISLFEECGFKVVQVAHGRHERISLPRRLLLIKRKKRDSFLLQPNSA